jgi:putative spermidine/putrescine transport system ATP-binding protein
VALARAIVFEPRILLMDEPLSALDKKLREQMQIEIKHLHEKLGMTTVYVTHDQKEALTMSDRVAVINDGRFVQLDEPRQLYERPRSQFVADFIGESSFLPVTLNGGDIMLDGAALKLAEPPFSDRAEQLLVLRPEKLEVLGEDAGGDLNRLEGQVKELVYQGESFLFYVTLAEGVEIAVRSPSRREALAAVPEPGAPIRLGLHPEDTIVVPA